ncbi:MAG: peptidoglycan-binding domain-containing protein [Syntrophomonas sp.]|nr:peptidoglycan-binding domain-containing protein [Syntrophomonas sp.]
MAINKLLIGLLITATVLLGGCSGSTAQYPQRSPDLPAPAADKQMSALDEVITDPNIKKDENLAHNENIQELKHLKYGVRPGEGSDVSSKTSDESAKPAATPLHRSHVSSVDEPYSRVNIQLLTVEELDAVIAELIKQDYLQQKPANEEELSNALSQFQSDHNLTPSGKIDAATLKIIKE